MSAEDFKTGYRYYLSTEGFYFEYRADRYASGCIRAELFRTNGEKVLRSELNVLYEQYGIYLAHDQVINYYEAKISLGEISRGK